MSALRSLSCLLLLAGGLAVAVPAQAGGDCASASMTVTAALSNDPGFEGLYKYTVTGSWDVSQFGLSHIDFFLELETLECICDPSVVQFANPAGTSSGTNDEGPCKVNYTGQYLCMGDPTVPSELQSPTIKFDQAEGDCEAGVTGTGTWVFYSPFPPAPYSVYPDGLAIKHGQGVCTGDLSGQMPMGDCSTPAHPKSWGNVKAIYR